MEECSVDLNILADDVKIPTVNNPEILDITFDSLYSFTTLMTAIIIKVQSRNKILNR